MKYKEFEQLVTEVGPEVYSFCLQLTRNRIEAEELYQDTMLTAMERHKDMEARKNPKSYLIGITIGLWKNVRRKYARRNRIRPETSWEDQLEEVYFVQNGQSLEEEVAQREETQLVRQAVEALPEKYRIPVYLYYSREMSVEEISAVIHIPKGTVKSRLHKARKLIKNHMEAEGYEG